jgi:SAM-dependent methyltransferase
MGRKFSQGRLMRERNLELVSRISRSPRARSTIRRLFPWLTSEPLVPTRDVQVSQDKTPFQQEIAGLDNGSLCRFSNATGFAADIMPPLADVEERAADGEMSLVDYMIIGDSWSFFLNRFLKPRSTVLEIGSECGTIARRLVLHSQVEKFIGVGFNAAGVDWCQRNITPKAGGRFSFDWLDRYSGSDNSRETGRGLVIDLPAPDGSVDIVFSRSWLARLGHRDVRRLLGEVRRILAPGGVLLASVRTGNSHSSIVPDKLGGGPAQRNF